MKQNKQEDGLSRIEDDNSFYIYNFIKGLKLAREIEQKKLSV